MIQCGSHSFQTQEEACGSENNWHVGWNQSQHATYLPCLINIHLLRLPPFLLPPKNKRNGKSQKSYIRSNGRESTEPSDRENPTALLAFSSFHLRFPSSAGAANVRQGEEAQRDPLPALNLHEGKSQRDSREGFRVLQLAPRSADACGDVQGRAQRAVYAAAARAGEGGRDQAVGTCFGGSREVFCDHGSGGERRRVAWS